MYAANFKGSFGIFVEGSAHSEIDNFEVLLIRVQKHDILRLKISVHDPVGMTMMYTWKYLFHIESSLIFSETALLDYPIEEFSAFAVVHDDIKVLAFRVDVVEADDVGMILSYLWVY